MKKRIPTKLVRVSNDLPWLTREAKQLVRRKNRAHKATKKSKSSQDWKRFRLLRKSVQKQLHEAHEDCLRKLLDPESDTNSKDLWRYLKAKKQDSVGVSTLKAGGKLISDAKEKAEVLNKQFCCLYKGRWR